MKKFTVMWSVMLILLAASFLSAQVNVTFRVNASTEEGFTDSTDVIQVRGGTAPLQWSASGPAMTNIGGDYWTATVAFDAANVGTTIEYKYGATRLDATTGTNYDWWEGHDNRTLVLPDHDTTLVMDYLSATEPPYTPSDSIDVFFRVNMSSNPGFNPSTDILSIVGAFPGPDGADNMWNPGHYRLTREGPASDYWSYHLKLNSTADSTMYRFVIGSDWNNTEQIYGHGMFPDNENRGTVVNQDTTLAWKWWNDVPPSLAGNDTVTVKFQADLTTALNENGFSIGDTLIVRWGYNFTAQFEEDTLANVPLTNLYAKEVQAKNVGLGMDLQYQYYVVQNGQDYREIFFDFNDNVTSSQEKRKVLIPSPKPAMVEVNDNIDSKIALHRMPRFQNTSPISQDVLVTYTCDLRPAYWQVKLEGDTIRNIQSDPPFGWVYPGQQDSILSWGVYLNGPGNGTGGWQGWDLTALATYKLYDDGTHGDLAAGDSVYAIQVLFSPDSSDIVGQEFKFGLNAGDNEGGNTGFGLNHIQNIDDSQTQFTIHTDFGSINPQFYWRWDFTNHVVGIENQDVTVISSPQLNANYPNPFNPVTTISFAIPKIMDVDLVIYDILGRKVRTLLSGKQQSGAHQVLWNGTNDHGQVVSTGIYYYRLKTENYEKTMKMILMK